MIVVVEKGYASWAGAAAEPKGKGFNFGAFGGVVMKDRIPLVDSISRTQADREHRAIVGLPTGGGAQALRIGLTHLGTFSAVGAFSGTDTVDPKTSYGGVFADPAVFDETVDLLDLHSGTVGLDEGIHQGAKALYETLQQGGVRNVVFRDLEGQGHEWQTRRYAERLRPAAVAAKEVTPRPPPGLPRESHSPGRLCVATDSRETCDERADETWTVPRRIRPGGGPPPPPPPGPG